jgi:hypothetical protein
MGLKLAVHYASTLPFHAKSISSKRLLVLLTTIEVQNIEEHFDGEE